MASDVAESQAAEVEQLRAAWARVLRALYGASKLTSNTRNLDAVFGTLTRTIAHLAAAKRAAFWALQADGSLAVQRDAFGFSDEELAAVGSVPAGNPGDPIHQVERRQRDDPPGRAPWLDIGGVSEAIVVPWNVGDQSLGLLGIYDSARPRGFTEADLWVARAAALAAGLVWQERRGAARLIDIERQDAVRLREYAERMAALERIKSNVLNLAAHELRSPLAVIRGYLSLIEEGTIAGPEEMARVRPILSAKANQIAALVDEMLETARLEDGRIELHMERLDLRDIVQEVVDSLHLGPERWLVLQKAAEPVPVLGDRLRLSSIVANLLDNGIKYSPGGGAIRCSVAVEKAACVVRVIDRGIGIAETDLPTLFTRFGRIVTDTNSHIPGTGLGLYLCRELALMHGGDIAVESHPGVGSAFDLVLPRLHPRRDARPAGYDVTTFGLSDMIRCSAELRRLGGASASLDQAAQRMVRHLYEQLRAGEDGERASALVRMFRALPYSRLAPEQQEITRRALGGVEPEASMLCLCLVATAGDRREWNSPKTSAGHQVIPLQRGGRWSPMVARLVRDLGVEPGRVRDPDLFLDLIEKTCNVFHVPEAEGSQHVPAQVEFVKRYGIRSVLGFGGILAPLDLYAVIIFSKAPIGRGSAQLFRAISHSAKLALQPFSGHLAGAHGPRLAVRTGAG